jgi:hypothetical protein
MLLSENELNSQNLQEFENLLAEFSNLDVNCFIEIGSLYGWTLQHFIHYANEGSTAISIDLPVRKFVGPGDWRVQKQEDNYKNVWPVWAKQKKCKLYLIPDESQKAETQETVNDILKGRNIDFLFIDGNHTYSGVKMDFEIYSKLVRPGGIIAFHDIGENEEGGVYNLWQELKGKYKHKEFLLEKNKEKGIGVLFV